MIKEKSFLDPLFKWIVESKSVFCPGFKICLLKLNIICKLEIHLDSSDSFYLVDLLWNSWRDT